MALCGIGKWDRIWPVFMDESRIPPLLTLREASEILKCHPNTLRLWDKKGILKAVRFGERGDRRFRKEDIMKLINNQRGLTYDHKNK